MKRSFSGFIHLVIEFFGSILHYMFVYIYKLKGVPFYGRGMKLQKKTLGLCFFKTKLMYSWKVPS